MNPARRAAASNFRSRINLIWVVHSLAQKYSSRFICAVVERRGHEDCRHGQQLPFEGQLRH
jgi:hypothetical protein